MSMVHFHDIPCRVFGRALLLQMEIVREEGIVIVREKRRKKRYEITLSSVATIAYERCIRAEVAAKKAQKAAKRKEKKK